ncbi:ComEA family DNA-binding protein [Algoriphagus mannitolivorans]|uniref:ComEA family DNA-binding protein n=1 Tax=Algoriphagus mannitolivorans TaxID=226504 RepID=UPI000411648A|nr:helix-hairpin-helix domain-containing protein [Algoriphagus mannitolivorans]
MNRFFYFLKTYIGFSHKESRGFLLLVPFLLILGISPYALSHLKNKKGDALYASYLHRLDSLQKAGEVLISPPLPSFNPSDTISTPRKRPVPSGIQKISFSEADSVTLQIVPGIGPSLAGRIIKYREAMGGFHSKSQLSEIFGLKAETIEGIWEYFDFAPQITRKIPINTCDLEELAKHPYITFQEAKVMIAFRNQHGAYASSGDLLKIKIFKKEWIDQISPYLDFAQ